MVTTAPTKVEDGKREAWLEKKQGHVGASEVAAMLGKSPWEGDTALKLWGLKTGRLPPIEQSEPMRIGLLAEDLIDTLFQIDTGRRTRSLGQFVIQRCDEFPHLGATLDRVQTVDHRSTSKIDIFKDGPTPGTLQLKNVGSWVAKHWMNEAGDQIVPDYTDAQCQAEMAASKMEWGSAAVLIGGNDFRWCDIERRPPEWFQRLQDAIGSFWRCVESDTPPEATGKDAGVVKALYPRHEPGVSVALPIGANEIADHLRQLKYEVKDRKDQIESYEAMIKAWIGKAERGVCPDGTAFTWRAHACKEVVHAAHTKRPLLRKDVK